ADGGRAPESLAYKRILVVEDDESHAIAVKLGLEREGFDVTSVYDAPSALTAIAESDPDVVLLDVMLPGGMSGIDVCKRMRESGLSTPVIMVSARSEELDVVVAMEIGADDYVAKPYRMRELVARIRAVMRRGRLRVNEQSVPDVPPTPGAYEVGDVLLDPDRHEVYVRGEQVELPLREFRLLEELLRNAGLLLTRETLLERVWGYDFEGDPKILSTLVNRLRARIEEDPDNPVRIVTIRGLGYRYERPRPPRLTA
ncbi:MAG TPA: response regulator transcription factor, partial [Acidimicrobiales bacterium]|nr:response regulator transcription factor [Acidimicrobiales bacterium]